MIDTFFITTKSIIKCNLHLVTKISKHNEDMVMYKGEEINLT